MISPLYGSGHRITWPECVESVEARARLCSAAAGKLLTTTDTVTVGRRGFYYACLSSYLELFATTLDRYINVIVSFYRATVLVIAILSVHPSVRLSV